MRVPAKERALERGTRRGRLAIADLGRELRDARIRHGLSQTQIGRSVGLSAAQVSRIERGLSPRVPVLHLARLLSTVGLELAARAFPAGTPLRDVAHARLLERLRAILPAAARWRTEVPLAIRGDQRAWDATIELNGAVIGVEAETRPTDLQALGRRLALKRRDGGSDLVVLLLANTRHNRQLLALGQQSLAADYPVDGRAALEAFRSGNAPEGSAVILL
jgi:transcriptional regulator with XRE-family HTH domain